MATKEKATKILAVGSPVIIRTVTYHYTGRIVALDADTVTLEDAAWIADSGRWAQALATGSLSEVEPYPAGVVVMRAAVVDVSPWQHALPRETK